MNDPVGSAFRKERSGATCFVVTLTLRLVAFGARTALTTGRFATLFFVDFFAAGLVAIEISPSYDIVKI